MGRPLVDKFITGVYKLQVQAVLSRASTGVETADCKFAASHQG